MKKILLPLLIPLFSIIIVSTVFSADILIKPGNIVHITVLGYPELSMAVVVRQDGTTEYPLLANVPIDGMTIHQLQELLQPLLARLVERPKIFISIAEYMQLEVTIEGQVQKPGPYTVKGPINLQGVLTIAGGTTQLADLRNITIIRQEYDTQRELVVDLYQSFQRDKSVVIPEIEDGDIIFVPIITPNSSVRVMGAVRSPGPYIPVKDENIADMIYMAGGPESNGNMNRITYISMFEGRREVKLIKLKKLLNKGQTDSIPLALPGDIIIVENINPWQSSSWWLQVVREAAYLMSSIVIISRL